MNCTAKKSTNKICVPYKEELKLSFGERLKSVKNKIKSLENAYINAGDTLVYLDVDRFARDSGSIKSTFYLFFLNNSLSEMNLLYEFPKKDTSVFQWIKDEITKCSELQFQKKSDTFWEYRGKNIFLKISISYDGLNDSTVSCRCLVSQTEIVSK